MHEIIKIKGKDSIDFIVRHTHRGPLVYPEVIIPAEGIFFGSVIPEPKYKHYYSLKWGGMYPGEHLYGLVLDIASGMGVKEFIKSREDKGDDGYRSLPMNLMFADN